MNTTTRYNETKKTVQQKAAPQTKKQVRADQLVGIKYILRRFNKNLRVQGKYYLPSGNLSALEREVERSCEIVDVIFEEQFSLNDMGFDLESFSEHLNSITKALSVDDTYVKKIEASLVFIFQLSRSTAWVDVMLALANYLQVICVGSLTKTFKDTIIDKFKTCFTTTFTEQAFSFGDLEAFEEGIDSLREGFDCMASMSELPIMKKLHKFLLYCLSHSLFASLGLDFDFLGYSKFEAEHIKRAHSSKAGFMFCLFDSLSLFCKQFVQSVKIGSFEPFYHSGPNYLQWVAQVTELKRKEHFLTNPTPHGFNIFDFRSDLDEALEKGAAIMKVLKYADRFTRDRLTQYYTDLQMMKSNDISRKSSQRDRAAPFGVMYFGGSSIGKSTLINITFQYYAQLFGYSCDTSNKYTRNPGEKYWNGFTTSQWCIVMDDIAAQSPGLGTDDPSLKEIIGVMNNVAYQPDQASLEDKGKTPVQAKLVIATTNTEHLNAQAYFSCPLAVQRRLPWVVEVTVKPQHAHNRMLDHATCNKQPGKYADYWLFTVKRVVPETDSASNTKGKTQTVHEFSNIEDYLHWFGTEVQQHEAIQDLIGREEIETSKITVCTQCLYPSYYCGCDYDPPRQSESSGYASDDVGSSDQSESEEESYEETHARLAPEVMDAWRDSKGCLPTSSVCSCCLDWPCRSGMQTQSLMIDNGTFSITGNVYHYSQCLSDFFLAIWGMDTTWDGIDRESFCYTLCTIISLTLYYVLWYLVGPFFFFIFGAKFFRELTEIDWRNLIFEFALRRLSRRVREHYAPLIQYSKVFLVLSSSIFVAGAFTKHVLSKAIPRGIVEPCPHCQRDNIAFMRQTADKVGRMPETTGQQRTNVWYKEEFTTSRFDVTDMTSSWKALDREKVRAMVKNNCARAFLKCDNKTSSTGILALGGQLYALNSHAVPKSDTFVLEIMRTAENGVNGNHRCIITQSQVYYSTKSDVAFVTIKGLPPVKDISGLMPKDSFNGKFIGEYLGVTSELEAYSNKVFKVTQMPMAGSDFMYFGGVSENLTKLGDCGSPLLVFTEMGPTIVGIHSLGAATHEIRAARILIADIHHAREALGTPLIQNGEPQLNAPSATERQVIDLDKKSPFRYIEQGSAHVYGSLSGARFMPKSRVVRTCIADAVEKYGFTQKFSQPVMKGYVPWRIAALDMVEIPTGFRDDVLEHAIECYAEDILSLLTPEDLAQVHVYDMFTAINGRAGLSYVDKMNRNTSAGFPWCKTKRAFIHTIEPMNDLQDPVDVNDEIRDRINKILETYQEGRRVMPVFMAHLKDEPTKFAKIEAGKTRVFGGAPFDWSVVCRMYMLPIIRLIQDNRYVFESAPGTIAQSKEWHDMREYLTAFGEDRMVAGDYKAFDKSMPPVFILGAYKVMSKICAQAGYTPDELRVVDGLAFDTAFPLFNLNGDLVEFFGSNPSGHPLTVIVNGLANALYMRYCYAILNPQHTCKTFKNHVHLMTYGDDNVMGVSKHAPWFDHTAVQKVLSDHGVTYTMADKTSESVPYIHIDQVSFLKREWRFDPEVGHYLCPLDEESIEKSLITCVASKSIAPEEQAMAIMSTACNEYWFYGREKFEKMRKIFLEIVHQQGLDILIEETTFPTWETIHERYMSYEDKRTWQESLKHFV